MSNPPGCPLHRYRIISFNRAIKPPRIKIKACRLLRLMILLQIYSAAKRLRSRHYTLCWIISSVDCWALSTSESKESPRPVFSTAKGFEGPVSLSCKAAHSSSNPVKAWFVPLFQPKQPPLSGISGREVGVMLLLGQGEPLAEFGE